MGGLQRRFGSVRGDRCEHYLEARSPSRLAWVKGDNTLVTAPQGHTTPHLVSPHAAESQGRFGGRRAPSTAREGCKQGPILEKGLQQRQGGEQGVVWINDAAPRQWPCWCHQKGPPCPELGSATASPSHPQEPRSIPGGMRRGWSQARRREQGKRGGAGAGGVVPNTHPPRDTTSFTFTL